MKTKSNLWHQDIIKVIKILEKSEENMLCWIFWILLLRVDRKLKLKGGQSQSMTLRCCKSYQILKESEEKYALSNFLDFVIKSWKKTWVKRRT